jgi:hypothetical protein
MESSQNPKTQTQKLNDDDKYIPYSLLEQLIKETDIPKEMIEEEYSELWFETLTGKGKVVFDNNIQYNGNVRYGLFESGDEPASIIFTDGTRYEGDVHNNQLTGNGVFYFPTGATYHGEVLNGLRHGQGIYTSQEGNRYEGSWKNGLLDGYGTYTTPYSEYEGEWKEGSKHGKGRIKWESGNVYEGEL